MRISKVLYLAALIFTAFTSLATFAQARRQATIGGIHVTQISGDEKVWKAAVREIGKLSEKERKGIQNIYLSNQDKVGRWGSISVNAGSSANAIRALTAQSRETEREVARLERVGSKITDLRVRCYEELEACRQGINTLITVWSRDDFTAPNTYTQINISNQFDLSEEDTITVNATATLAQMRRGLLRQEPVEAPSRMRTSHDGDLPGRDGGGLLRPPTHTTL